MEEVFASSAVDLTLGASEASAALCCDVADDNGAWQRPSLPYNFTLCWLSTLISYRQHQQGNSIYCYHRGLKEG